MSIRSTTPKVGQFVYKPYAPTKAGVITMVGNEHVITNKNTGVVYVCPGDFEVNVTWSDGTTTCERSSYLNDFMALVEDHKKKLNTHLQTWAKLKLITLAEL